MFDTLYKEYLNQMSKSNNPYSFLELMMSEGLIPGYFTKLVPRKTMTFFSAKPLKWASLYGIYYNFFDLLEDSGAMISSPVKRNVNTLPINHEKAWVLTGVANDNKRKADYTAPSKVA
ncbi:MAG: hypothetical protein ACKVIX_07910 [Sphingomonadales bacterium]|jgi:hypothetical protein